MQCFEVPRIQAALSTWILPGGICLCSFAMYDLQSCLILPLCICGKASVMLAKSDAQVYHLLYIKWSRLHIHCCSYTKPAQAVACLYAQNNGQCITAPHAAFHCHYSTKVTVPILHNMLQKTHLYSLHAHGTAKLLHSLVQPIIQYHTLS